VSRVSAGHAHTHAQVSTSGSGAVRALAFALALTAAYTVLEGAAGFFTDSLALLADAGHNLSDVFALAIALTAAWLARRPPTPERSFGFARAEILAAFVNAVVLVVIAIVIAIEALRRLGDPPDVPGGWLVVVAALGFVVNAVGAAVVYRGGAENLNLRASFIHLGGDAFGSALVVVTGLVILATGFELADPIASLALSVLIVWSAIGVLRESIAILMEGAPAGVDSADVARAILSVPGVESVHDLHVWTISTGFAALSAHVLVRTGDDCHARRRELEGVLHDRFGIDHTTLQVEHSADELLQITRR
jgi:cobalt-zinc-cadmium efflux system protein